VTLAGIGAGLFALALALSAGLCAAVRLLAPRVGLVDRPGGRKAHRRPTPLGGGVAIWLTVMLVLGAGAVLVFTQAASLPESLRAHLGGMRSRHGELLGVMLLATLIMLVGLADDRRALSWKPRLLAQFGLAAAFVALWGGVTLFPPFSSRLFTGVVTVVWIVGLTNSFNFLDNMDGLAGSVGLIAALLFAAAQVAVGGLFVPAVLIVLAGALAGFLVHNWNPARLFMGDAGSNFLGFLLGVLTVTGTFARPFAGGTPDAQGGSPFGVLVPLLVMAVPLYDTASVIAIRLREGRSPFQPDRRHFSHRLVERGLTPARAVGTIDLVTLAAGLGALLLHRLDAPGAALIVAQTACLIGLVAILEFGGTGPTRAEPAVERHDGAARPETTPSQSSSTPAGP
jgi:UDP-GlcNAc:undecaprenyl-phosphate GlcNAc-1-phosphate transferase